MRQDQDVGPFEEIPAAEFDHLEREIRRDAALLDMAQVAGRYRAAGLDVRADPLGPSVAEAVEAALAARTPLSVVRIGDGEAHFLCFGRDPGTPVLDRHGVEMTMRLFVDRCRATEAAMMRLRTEMEAAVAAADVVGVLGLWRSKGPETERPLSRVLANLRRKPRGIAGQWRGMRQLLRMAEEGALAGKAIRSAHLYLGLAPRVPDLARAAPDGTLCVTNRPRAVAWLRDRVPGGRVDMLELRREPVPPAAWGDMPDFLDDVRRRLPDDLTGRLVLIGAGAWAEVYCTEVKARGGVAVDLGSGFDLMAGRLSRPAHRSFLEREGLELGDFLSGG